MKKGSKQSEKAKEKRRQWGREHPEHKPNLGKKFSDAHRKSLSLSHLGHIPWNKGKPFVQMLGNKYRLGVKHTDEEKKKVSVALLGITRSRETRMKMAVSKFGNKYGWKGGLSFCKYPSAFNRTLRLATRQRDDFTCQKCGITEEEHLKKIGRVLSVNHIDFNKNNCDSKNLNTLCLSCNSSVNFNREHWTNFFKQKLCDYQTQ